MGWHGEATRVLAETVDEDVRTEDGHLVAPKCRPELPLAGLKVSRSIRMARDQARLCRSPRPLPILAIWGPRVQPSSSTRLLGPPFLDESTRVDANGTRGLYAGNAHANARRPRGALALCAQKGRHRGSIFAILTDDAAPAVVSYIIEEEYGWTTAINASKGLLIGYIWPEERIPLVRRLAARPRRQALCPRLGVWHYGPAPT